eukprot:3703496-Heterocapsa_arctica.AAC.1
MKKNRKKDMKPSGPKHKCKGLFKLRQAHPFEKDDIVLVVNEAALEANFNKLATVVKCNTKTAVVKLEDGKLMTFH